MSKNDITGDKLISRPASPSYRDNYDKIFKAKREDVLDGEEFYNLMQAYRFASSNAPSKVIAAFDAVKSFIRKLAAG